MNLQYFSRCQIVDCRPVLYRILREGDFAAAMMKGEQIGIPRAGCFNHIGEQAITAKNSEAPPVKREASGRPLEGV